MAMALHRQSDKAKKQFEKQRSFRKSRKAAEQRMDIVRTVEERPFGAV
jgi:hypothetical protein